jgi:hypothetical protein
LRRRSAGDACQRFAWPPASWLQRRGVAFAAPQAPPIAEIRHFLKGMAGAGGEPDPIEIGEGAADGFGEAELKLLAEFAVRSGLLALTCRARNIAAANG